MANCSTTGIVPCVARFYCSNTDEHFVTDPDLAGAKQNNVDENPFGRQIYLVLCRRRNNDLTENGLSIIVEVNFFVLLHRYKSFHDKLP